MERPLLPEWVDSLRGVSEGLNSVESDDLEDIEAIRAYRFQKD